MSRYAVRIGSVLALLLSFCALAPASAQSPRRASFTFEDKRMTFTFVPQPGGRAISIDDGGLQSLFAAVGATVTWQRGQRYVLVTTAEPVVISFALGDRRYDVGPVTQNASFAPFLLNGHAYVPFDELVRALNLAPKGQVLQPQLTSISVDSSEGGSKLVAHAGMPLDARVVSDSGGKIVIAFDGVGTTLPRSRNLTSGPVRRIDMRTEGSIAHPRTLVTLSLATGTTHTAPGTDDQRDFTMGFNGAAAAQPVAAAQPTEEPEQAATPASSPLPQATVAAGVQVTAVQTQAQDDRFSVRVVLNGNAPYDWHRLRPPDNRFWIDVHGARLAIPPLDQPGNEIVTAVRARQQTSDTVRVALSLADFQIVDVTPDASGVTISVANSVADSTVARSGAGRIGDTAIAYASPPPSGNRWKFSPRPAPPPKPYNAGNPRLIVIDPGHGGSDWGSIRGDAVEKNLALDMSKRVRDILVARGWQVMMTRDTDRDVFAPNDSAHDELQARDDVANNNGARIFLSIHVNAFINSGPHGATVYYYKPLDVALAQALDRRIGGQVPIADDGIVKDKLYVVHHANMPAALVEAAFISNPDDRTLLQSPQWRQKMAQAIADGIADYAGPPPPPGNVGRQ
jgi:N-acetylmuramoyl-L-alanine amidase